MIVTWQQLGRFGNNMFQYALARVIAEKYNISYRTDVNFNEEETHNSGFYDEFLNLDKFHKLNVNSFYALREDNIDNLLKLDEYGFKHSDFYKKNLRLEGYFQDNKYFNGKDVKKYFKVDESRFIDNEDDDLCISLRLGNDYKCNNWVIDSDSIVNFIDNIYFNRLFIVTDVYDQPILDKFEKYSPIIYNNSGGKPINDFYTLMSFKNLLITNSTFSYWAAVLGKSETIYALKDWKFNSLTDIIGKEDKTILYNA